MGCFFAKGGTGAIVEGLEKLMREEGIRILTGKTVKRIQVEKRRATAVCLDDETAIEADTVVSNADPLHLYRKLLPTESCSRLFRVKQNRMVASMALFVLFFGTARTYPDVAHHTIWFGERYRELIHEIFHGNELPRDFSLYLHRPKATDPSFAPAGCDSFYVLAPVPNLRAQIDWAEEGPILRDRRVNDAVRRTLWLSDRYYQSAQRGFVYIPLRNRRVIFIAAAVYRGIGQKILRSGAQGWRECTVVGTGEKFAIVFRALWDFRVMQHAIWARDATPTHDRTLHSALGDPVSPQGRIAA